MERNSRELLKLVHANLTRPPGVDVESYKKFMDYKRDSRAKARVATRAFGDYPTRSQGLQGYWGAQVTDAKARLMVMRHRPANRPPTDPASWYMVRKNGHNKFILYHRHTLPRWAYSEDERRRYERGLVVIHFLYRPAGLADDEGALFSYDQRHENDLTHMRLDPRGVGPDPLELIARLAIGGLPLPFINTVGTMTGYDDDMNALKHAEYAPPPKPVHRRPSNALLK